jgi:SAM-dependent methyltransferase
MDVVGFCHKNLVFGRRVRVLSDWFARMVPPNAAVLDVGCGDGLISSLLLQRRPDVQLTGLEVLPRPNAHITVQQFDGLHLPYPDRSFDVVMFSDVLHHTDDAAALLAEARRVTRGYIVLKDHFRKGVAAGLRLRFMDWVGNARFGVSLPYNYWSEERWNDTWRKLELRPEEMVTRLGLYPGPADWLFGGDLHFIARLAAAN